MNYFELYPGDYLRDTGTLTLAEHGAFLLLMAAYYATEKPLPSDNPTLFRLVRAMTEDEQKAALKVADMYFPISDEDGLRHNVRADQEIPKARIRIEAARENGKRGGRPPKPKENPPGLDQVTQIKPNGKAPHAPRSNDLKDTPIVPTGDESEILSAYREHLPHCQGVSVLNPKRRRRIRDAIKLARSVCAAQGWPYEAARFWHAYFSECARDPWMRGEVKNPNNPNWKQNLDVLIAEDRFAGVMDRAIERLKAAA